MSWSWKHLRAGAFKLDGGAMFGLVPKPLWQRLVQPDDRNRIALDTNCLLVEGHGKLVLIEVGLGDKYTDKQRDIYAMESRSILDALHEVDCRPEDIDAIVLTHLHFDHAGALTRYADDGESAVPNFPNAEVISQKTEWEDALAGKSTMHSTYLRNHLDPIAERVRTVEGESEVLPDMSVFPAPGHTWGQQAIRFADSSGRTIVYPGDALPTVNHAGLTYNMAYDVIPYTNMATKKSLLTRCHDEGWTIALDHDPETPFVEVEPHPKRAGEFVLSPAEITL